MLNFSEASERNKGHILPVLQQHLGNKSHLLEIGSGSGQHALYCAPVLSHLRWQPSELEENLNALQVNLAQEQVENIDPPQALNVFQNDWQVPPTVDAIFSANTLHIMSQDAVDAFFRGAGKILPHAGRICVYGPFRYGGRYTSESNAQFDQWLQLRDPQSGIRDFEVLNALATELGLVFVEDITMPANNQILVWQKQ